MTKREHLSIELGETATYLCPCCARESETVHGFLSDDGGATSIYFAGYTHGHPERRVNMMVSIGGWGEGTTPDDRQAIALEVRAGPEGSTIHFRAPETSPWYEENFLGRMTRPDELSDTEAGCVQALATFALEHDPRVASYLEEG
jgi:hypothetical protein